MTAITDFRRTRISGWVVAVFVVLTGCQDIYDVKVDAINNPQKPTGNSYVLEVQDPSGGVDKELGVQTVVSVKSALAARGLYEAPANTRPDMVINLEYGVAPGRSNSSTEQGNTPSGLPARHKVPRPSRFSSLKIHCSQRPRSRCAESPARPRWRKETREPRRGTLEFARFGRGPKKGSEALPRCPSQR